MQRSDIAGSSKPREFQLLINYRSHGGITGCAYSLVKIISSFWPASIDNIREEKSEVDGAKPTFFTGEIGEDGYTQFLEATTSVYDDFFSVSIFIILICYFIVLL
jgi:hypothetical protein